MEDDLDDLLDQIESKMTSKKKTSRLSSNSDCQQKQRTKQNQQQQNQQHQERLNCAMDDIAPSEQTRGGRQDLNDALDDIFDDGPVLNLSDSRITAEQEASHEDASSSMKCFPLLIGGSGDAVGLSTTVSKRCCANLRCYNCDFKVEMFDHYRWSPDTDYLFLRNNMPDFSKLQSRLLSRRSSRAYACQCQWTNAQEMEPLTGDLKRLWHCAGRHS